MGTLNHPEISRRDSTAGHKQYSRFLECIDNFLTQTIKEPVKGDALLDLIFANKEIGRASCRERV